MNTDSTGFSFFRPALESDNYLEELEDDRMLNCALRERAYVFWDAARIQQPDVMASLEHARNINRDEADRLYNGNFGPSVQERLDDVGIYHHDWEEIMRKTMDDLFYNDQYVPESDDDETG